MYTHISLCVCVCARKYIYFTVGSMAAADRAKDIVWRSRQRRRRRYLFQGVWKFLAQVVTRRASSTSTSTHCTTLHHTAPHCKTLPNTEIHCSILHNTATHWTHCNILMTRRALSCNELNWLIWQSFIVYFLNLSALFCFFFAFLFFPFSGNGSYNLNVSSDGMRLIMKSSYWMEWLQLACFVKFQWFNIGHWFLNYYWKG